MVIGINLLIGYAGQISLGHAAFYGIGAYSSAILTTAYGVNPWIAIVIAAFITGIIAYLIGKPSLKLKGHYLVMATLGFNIIITILLIQWEEFTGGPSGIPGIPYLEIGKFSFDSDQKVFFLIWFVAIISLILAYNLVNSRVGRALRAIHGSEVAASSLGVNISSYKVKVFVLSAVFASIAGSLYSHYVTFISPKTFDIMFSIKLIIMSIFGGISTIWGALIGSATLTVLGEVLTYVKDYSAIALGLILVLTLMFFPEGAVGLFKRKKWAKN
jgi:branched-chain amino acid transport system permease protein